MTIFDLDKSITIENCYAERLARRKVEAHYERQLKHQIEKFESFLSQKVFLVDQQLKDQIEELKAENRQLKNQLSNYEFQEDEKNDDI